MIGGFHLGAAMLAGFVILITASSLGQAPAPGSGKDLFERRCGGCHALDRDKEGPRLGGVYGRRAGSVDTFDYSEALKGANITWNDESLEKWLSGPEQMVPNTDMAFHLERADERREIVAFLKSNSGKEACLRRAGRNNLHNCKINRVYQRKGAVWIAAFL